MNLLNRNKGADSDGPKQEPTLRVEITDADCEEKEAWFYYVPLGTNWGDIQIAAELFHPTMTAVYIEVEE